MIKFNVVKCNKSSYSALQKNLLGKDGENSTMKKVNQELEEKIEKLKEDKQSQDERFEKI